MAKPSSEWAEVLRADYTPLWEREVLAWARLMVELGIEGQLPANLYEMGRVLFKKERRPDAHHRRP